MKEIEFPPFLSQDGKPEHVAVGYVMDWIGRGFWNTVSRVMAELPCTVCFEQSALELGVTCPAAQAAWYNLYHGGGAWQRQRPLDLAKHAKAEAEKAQAREAELRDIGRAAWAAFGSSVPDFERVLLPQLSPSDLALVREGWEEAKAAAEPVYGAIH